MPFNAGSVVAKAVLDSSKFVKGGKDVETTSEKMKKGLSNLSTAGFLAVGAAMGVSIARANEYQKLLSNVHTLVDVSDKGLDRMSDSILSMDAELGTATNLTEGLYQAISAGAAPGQQAFDTVTASAKFAKAALTDTSTAVDIITTAVNAYTPELVDANKASDLYFTTIKQGKINGEQLSAVIGQSIPLFASTGIAMEELTSGIAAMTKQGVQASETTTQMNAIVSSFLKPSEAMSKALKKQGYESGSAFLEAEGLKGALKLLEDQTGGNATAMFELLPNIRAVRGAMALTGAGGVEFNNILGEMENASGATDEAFEKQEKTFATFMATLDKTAIIIGGFGKGVLEVALGPVQTLIGTFNNLFLEQEKYRNSMTELRDQFSVEREDLMKRKTLLTANINLLKNNRVPESQRKKVIGQVNSELRKLNVTQLDQNFTLEDLVNVQKRANQELLKRIKITAQQEVLADKESELIKLQKEKFENDLFIFKAEQDLQVSRMEQADQTSNSEEDAMNNRRESVQLTMMEAEQLRKRNAEIDNELELKAEEIAAFKELTGIDLDEFTKENVIGFKELSKEIGKAGDAGNKTAEEITDGLDKFRSMATFASSVFSGLGSIISNISNSMISSVQQATEEQIENLAVNKELQDLALEEEKARMDDLELQKEEALSNEDAAEVHRIQREIDRINLEKKFAKQREKIEDDADKKSKKIARGAAITNKVLGITTATINTALAITEVLRNPIPMPNTVRFASAAAAGVLGAIEIATIASQQIPALAAGGTAFGLTRVNELGGEIQNLPDGTKVIPHDISMEIARSAGNVNSENIEINNNFAGAYLGNDQMMKKIIRQVSLDFGRQLQVSRKK